MTMPKSIDAYKDCEEYFAKAMTSARGIRVTLADRPAATQFIAKMNAYKVLLRKQSRSIYPSDHTLHGRSPYDAYKIAHEKDNEGAVIIRLYTTEITSVEEL